MLGMNNSSDVFQSYQNLGNRAKNDFINLVVDKMSTHLSGNQLLTMNRVLNEVLEGFEVFVDNSVDADENYYELNVNFVELFIKSKEIEGLSSNTLGAYNNVLQKLISYLTKSIPNTVADDIRGFLNYYKSQNNCGNATLDNVRRYLSSFFKWLYDEGYIMKSPVSQVKRIKSKKQVKKPFTDMDIAKIRDALLTNINHKNFNKRKQCLRDISIMELLLSSGIRVGECINLKTSDMDLDNKVFTVTGKGDKERKCYFNDQAQFRLKEYLKMRDDNCPYLFIATHKPKQLGISGIGRIFHLAGDKAGVSNVHPHRFRRTFATTLVKRGMPLEQVSKLLGHEQLETTTIYVSVSEEAIEYGHHKYI